MLSPGIISLGVYRPCYIDDFLHIVLIWLCEENLLAMSHSNSRGQLLQWNQFQGLKAYNTN